jgi:23S rRNA pseudouridine2605 synthase
MSRRDREKRPEKPASSGRRSSDSPKGFGRKKSEDNRKSDKRFSSKRDEEETPRRSSRKSFDKPERSDDSSNKSTGKKRFIKRDSTDTGSSPKPERRFKSERPERSEGARKSYSRSDDKERYERPKRNDNSERPSTPAKRSYRKEEGQEERGSYRKSSSPFSEKRSYRKDGAGKSPYPRKTRQAPTKNIYEGFREKSSSDLIRLNKYISNAGICSRREADELIKQGLITVNGVVVTEMGYKVKLKDEVRYEEKRLKPEKPVYLLLNKPKGFITTSDDDRDRKTVMDLVANACKEKIYPVGRLDRNTTGLLLFTNDGELAQTLTHPSYKVKKVYKVELDKALTKGDFQEITEGVRLEEGIAKVDDIAYVDESKKVLGIELHIGWNRIVRRIFETLGYEVVKLDRVIYAGLDKKDLPRGNWRFLSNEEVVHLKHFGKK